MPRGPKMTWTSLSNKSPKTKLERLLVTAITQLSNDRAVSPEEVFQNIEENSKV